ncbi:MAG TPA: hypothetical protein PKA64_23635 [Myxococcota bacterium]|nr:hypothetical protein [Myxococcota bacterium]
MGSLIRRVTLVSTVPGPQGPERVTTQVFKAKRRKRRPAWGRRLGRLRRSHIAARGTYWRELLGEYDKANRKHRLGSVLRAPQMSAKAMRRAMRTFRRG